MRRWNERNPWLPMSFGWLSARRWLIEKVRAFRPDVLYAHHTAVNGYLAAELQQSSALPFVITDHDFDEIASCENLPGRRKLFQFVVGRAYAMVTIAARMDAAMHRLFPQARTKLVYNGTDPIPEHILSVPRPPHLRDRLVLFSCGTFYQRKGFPLLIDAFAAVAAKHPSAVLRIIGDGEQRVDVTKAIQSRGVESRVTLLGFQPHEVVLQELVWSDAFALIGWDEPFATVYTEAIAAGRPVVCCSDGGFADVLVDGKHGFLVPPRNPSAAAQCLDRLLSDAGLRQRMGTAAKDLFEARFTWDRNAREMADIFAGAAATRKVSQSA
jgi:glycosyltransferase involved in cell wall biosynthesis